MAIAADLLALGLTELGTISERRIEKLTNTAFSALPPFLVEDAGLNSGFMLAQITAAALAAESKTLCHPASVDTIPTSADKEDHVSMGMGAALKLGPVVGNTSMILAIELAAAAQGIDLLRPLRSSPALERLHARCAHEFRSGNRIGKWLPIWRARSSWWTGARSPAGRAGRRLIATSRPSFCRMTLRPGSETHLLHWGKWGERLHSVPCRHAQYVRHGQLPVRSRLLPAGEESPRLRRAAG